MPIDDEVVNAINEAVEEVGQPDSVARRLIAWLNELSESSLGKEDDSRHLDMVRNALDLGGKE